MKTKLLAITICILLLSAMVPQSLALADDSVYATYLGGAEFDASSEHGHGIATDDTGNIYIIGSTESADFPVTPDAWQATTDGSGDVFLAKFDSSGALVYSTYFGGSEYDVGYGIALDSAGNIYVAGSTWSTDLPVTAGAWQPAQAGNGDAFLAKFDSSGVLVYSTYLGGPSVDYGYSIAVDSSGNSYLTGKTSSTDFPVTLDAWQATNAGGVEVFIALFDSSGNLAYGTYLGGTGQDEGYDIALDSTGSVYVTGRTYSTDFPVTAGAWQTTNAGNSDAFVTRFDSSGALVYSTYLGGNDRDAGNGIALDSAGNISITGGAKSADLPVTGDAYQPTNGGGYDAFLAKFDSSGALVYGTYSGGSGDDLGYGIAIDNSGNSSISGYTDSTDFPVTADAWQPTNDGGCDAFSVKFDSSGNSVYSTYVGGSGDDLGYSIAIDSSGNSSFSGYTDSTDFPVTADAFQSINGGDFDVFFFKMEGEEPPTGSSSLSATTNIVIPMVGIELDRTSIDYGDVNPGESSAVETVVITNTGTYDVDVTLEVQGADATAQDFYEQSLYVNSSLYDIAAVIASILIGGSQPVDTQLQVPATWSVPGAQEATYIFWAEATS